MANRSHTNLSIIEAVETLSSIADLEFDRDVGIAQRHELILHNEKIAYKTVHWLHKHDASETVNLVRDTFRVILHYLKQFYKREYGYVTDPKTIEGIKTIMVLVGEAAKKLDKYTNIFHQTHQRSVTEFKEYKQLQEFYLSKIARKIDEGVLGKWILGLSLSKLHTPVTTQTTLVPAKAPKMPDTKHVFVDLESVKKDIEYELFFIRKEDGTRYFSSRLLRNIKLVCDFGSYFGERKGIDPLENVNQWLDRILHTCARNMLKTLGGRVDHYFQEIAQVKNNEVVAAVNKTLMALMLSSHSHNLLRHTPIKSCAEYFDDFQSFLRLTLQTDTYQRWLAYPPKANDTIANDLIELIHTMCRTLYSNLHGLEELVSTIHVLIQDANQQQSQEHQKQVEISKQRWNRLASDYAGMVKLLKRHPNGPLFKVLELLEANSYQVYDPLLQHNIPSQLFDLYMDNQRIANLRLAAPIYQEFIHKSQIIEEFKGFLRSGQSSKKDMHLLINLQDRTSWVDHARCVALEELQNHADMKDLIRVVTLAVDTDFYHQLAPYHQMNHADVFIQQFKEHLQGEGSGFYFPPQINQKELAAFIDNALPTIHRVFFSNKNVLLREHRLDFIEIFYLFLTFKLIDMVKPTSFSLTCKDGIDIGPLQSTEMFVFLKLLNSDAHWTEHEIDYLNYILYAPALLIRERVVLPERFNRMISALRAIENTKHEFGDRFSNVIQEEFSPLFKTPILQSALLLPS